MTLPLEKEQKNLGGRPVGSMTKISKLQRIANRLEQMARTQSMNIIQQSLDGVNVDKAVLDTAKWVVGATKQYHQAVQLDKENMRKRDEDKKNGDELEEEDDIDTGAKFSLHIIKTDTE